MPKKILLGLLLVVVIGTVGVAFWVKINLQSGALQQKVISSIFPAFDTNASSTFFSQQALGFRGERTYLVLLLNNTELRPGGGFIGAYAVVTFVNGKLTVEKVEGTEILDNAVPNIGTVPPAPLAEYLKIKTLQFRDSNWSPDFAVSSARALEHYRAENGVAAEKINGVIGITPTVFEKLLAIIGPITVNGIELTSSNFTEQVEYEVEYGYAKHGVTFSDRKQFLTDLSAVIGKRMLETVITHWSDYIGLLPKMLAQKHILFYAVEPNEQWFLKQAGFAGELKQPNGDYVMWVDANLGALKTDVVIDRSLSYSVLQQSSSTVATLSMRYHHTAGVNWRTNKYRDYARVFAPAGSKLVSVVGSADIDKRGQPVVDRGEENGKQWFGTYTVILPGTEATLSFTYVLPSNITEQIQNGSYALYVQKQAGTIAPPLTLHVGFGTKLTGATPGEMPDKYDDAFYDITTNLMTDRTFAVMLAR